MVLADSGKRVVLISADLRKPRLHRFFTLETEPGLSNALAGEATVWDSSGRLVAQSRQLALVGRPSDG